MLLTCSQIEEAMIEHYILAGDFNHQPTDAFEQQLVVQTLKRPTSGNTFLDKTFVSAIILDKFSLRSTCEDNINVKFIKIFH